MYCLFYSLYVAMFIGSWQLFSWADVKTHLQAPLNDIGTFLTSLFNNVDNPFSTLGDAMFASYYPKFIYLAAFVLALITSIGIVVVATKGIKKIFTVFFYGVR